MRFSKLLLTLLLLTVSATVLAKPADRLGPSGVLAPSGIPSIQGLGPGVEQVSDGGFEDGTPNPNWAEASANFGTPICDIGACGTGLGTGPNSGLYWAWFGGIGAYEAGSVSQSLTIPVGSAILTFFTEAIVCDSVADYMEAQIDGTVVFRIQGDDASCGNLGYVMQSIDVTAFADGGNHTLLFTSEIFANNGGGTNFFLDDVSLISTPFPATIPSLQWYGLAMLFLVLVGFGIKKSKARLEA